MAGGSDKEYMRDYRARNPEVVRRDKKIEKARRTAYRQLAEKYPLEFVVLFETAKRAEGV